MAGAFDAPVMKKRFYCLRPKVPATVTSRAAPCGRGNVYLCTGRQLGYTSEAFWNLAERIY